MECPPPPRDASLRNIIDKLAEFVARNGPEFEMITKQKQQNNPKFEFLYGGEFAGYYQYRVAAEQAFLNQQNQMNSQQQQQQQPPQQQQQQQSQILPHLMPPQQQSGTAPPHFIQGPPPLHHQQQQPPNTHEAPTFPITQPPPGAHIWGSNTTPGAQQQANGSMLTISLTAQIEAINMQQNGLREQIHQSEANLSAQHSALMTQQTKQIEEAIEAAQNAQLEKQADEHGIQLSEFDEVLQPIIESCTKDSISAGKNWILQHSSDSAKNNVVLQYVLKKALLNGSSFQQKLHLIYLVNDVLHHCVRKNVQQLKNSLENVVIPMFCSADLIATPEQRQKLTKLLSLWESKAKFFDACVISKLQSPGSSMKEYKTNLQNLHHDIASKFTQQIKATLDNYQKQHQMFIQHATQQIAQLEQQKQQLEQQMLASVLPNTSIMPPTTQQSQKQPQFPQMPAKIPSLMSQKVIMPSGTDSNHINPPGVDDNFASGGSTTANSNNMYQQQPQQSKPNNAFGGNNNFQNQQQIPTQQQQINHFAPEMVQHVPPNFFIPDLSKPPPGFLGNMTAHAGQLPAALQQQYAQMANIPPNASANIGDKSSSPGNIDMMSVNAMQMAHQQQQHLQQQQQQLLQQQQQQDVSPTIQPDEIVIQQQTPQLTEEEQKPTAPYYDLPAGLMVPLIRLEDYNYKPLDPTELRLPPPAPQNERLTNALAAFYAPPTHDRPRDTEGWEKLGLYEYYKVKNAAKKQKEEEILGGIREKTRSPSPIILEKVKPKKVNKRCYRSKSRSRSKTRSPYRSVSRSPPPRVRESRPSRSSRYNQRNRSPRRSPQKERERDTASSNREPRSERRRERSVTPPSFFGNNFTKPNEFIEQTNKGHQMLMKMGWAGTGTGLGTKNQGIEQPISSGEVRDRKDLYKGIGININDPFENFRKNKGAAFVHRMRARDEKN